MKSGDRVRLRAAPIHADLLADSGTVAREGEWAHTWIVRLDSPGWIYKGLVPLREIRVDEDNLEVLT